MWVGYKRWEFTGEGYFPIFHEFLFQFHVFESIPIHVLPYVLLKLVLMYLPMYTTVHNGTQRYTTVHNGTQRYTTAVIMLVGYVINPHGFLFWLREAKKPYVFGLENFFLWHLCEFCWRGVVLIREWSCHCLKVLLSSAQFSISTSFKTMKTVKTPVLETRAYIGSSSEQSPSKLVVCPPTVALSSQWIRKYRQE